MVTFRKKARLLLNKLKFVFSCALKQDGVAPPTPQADGLAPPTKSEEGVAPPTKPEDGVAPPTKPEDGVAPPTKVEEGLSLPTQLEVPSLCRSESAGSVSSALGPGPALTADRSSDGSVDIHYRTPPRAQSCTFHFHQPAFTDDNFGVRVKSSMVSLEYCVPVHNRDCLVGYVSTLNNGYQGGVSIRYTYNDWASFEDIKAEWCDIGVDVQTDRHIFWLPLEEKTEFAVCYTVGKQQHWDNNGSANYCATLSG